MPEDDETFDEWFLSLFAGRSRRHIDPSVFYVPGELIEVGRAAFHWARMAERKLDAAKRNDQQALIDYGAAEYTARVDLHQAIRRVKEGRGPLVARLYPGEDR